MNGTNDILFSYKFNEIIPLDKWKTTVLTRAKASIHTEQGGLEGKAAAGDVSQKANQNDDEDSEEL